MKPLSI